MNEDIHRIKNEILDSFDEELEQQLDEDRLDDLVADGMSEPTIDRRIYFRELFRLQHELVRLQDWVQYKKLKMVVLFEGRDSAGKGGAIRRVTQALDARCHFSGGGQVIPQAIYFVEQGDNSGAVIVAQTLDMFTPDFHIARGHASIGRE